jgi:hypothetical protein
MPFPHLTSSLYLASSFFAMTKAQRYLAFFISLFLSIIAHPLFAAPLFPKGEKPSIFIALPLTMVAILFAMAIHELGHLLAGMAQGFRFELYVVGPLGIKREQGKIKVYLNKNVAMMGGIAATIPTSQHPDNRKRFARLILAGPLTSLIYGLICIGVAYFSLTLTAFFLYVTGACSIALFLATTLPTKTGIYFTDRARYFRMISKGKEGDSEEALLQIIAQSVVDNHHKNISLQNVLTLQQDETAFMKFWGFYYEHLYYKENEIADKAEQTKSTLIANQSMVPKQVWKALKIEITDSR